MTNRRRTGLPSAVRRRRMPKGCYNGVHIGGEMRTFAWLFLVLIPVVSAAAPMQVTHQGRVLDSLGAPIQSDVPVTVSLYVDADSATTPFWTYTWASVPVLDGYYSLNLGQSPSPTLDTADFAHPEVWIDVGVGTGLQPRALLSSVPYAIESDVTRSVRASVVVDAVNAGEATWSGVDILRRTYAFTKTKDETTALVLWHDNLRCTGSSVACRWEVRFRPAAGGTAQPCTAPATIKADWYNGTNNFHLPTTVMGMCTATSAGPLTAGDWVAEIYLIQHPHASAEGASWTGWNTTASTFVMIEVD
jgi:hypothetical protein